MGGNIQLWHVIAGYGLGLVQGVLLVLVFRAASSPPKP